MYPLKFTPLYKQSIWGGRALEKFGRRLPEGKIGESWEISCHPDGVSVIANGEHAGLPLAAWLKAYKDKAVGREIYRQYAGRFPLMIKLIDANDNLSVQVHPSDAMARLLENEACGKNEMWYILSAAAGAKVICGFKPGFKCASIAQCAEGNSLEAWLNHLDVKASDAIYVPAGTVHSLGAGIVAVEIQQNSNITYRLYDYNRVTPSGTRRQLHIEKAFKAINDPDNNNNNIVRGKIRGLERPLNANSSATFLVANSHFAVELYEIRGSMEESAEGQFHIFVVVKGEGELVFRGGAMPLKAIESLLIPAALGKYQLCGNLTMLKTYVPKIAEHILAPLKRAGYRDDEILKNIHGGKIPA